MTQPALRTTRARSGAAPMDTGTARELASEVHAFGGVGMGENVRRVRLLVAVSAAALLALLVAWPSQGAVTEPPPLYLARDRGSTTHPAAAYLAVADGPRLADHVASDGEDLDHLQVIDSTGRVVVLHPNGRADLTGEVLDPEAVQSWLRDSFSARRQRLEGQVSDVGTVCSTEKEAARRQLDLPTRQGGRALTLAETLTEADARLMSMHRPESQISPWCIPRSIDTGHRAGYLHNLWHRITGTSDPGTS